MTALLTSIRLPSHYLPIVLSATLMLSGCFLSRTPLITEPVEDVLQAHIGLIANDPQATGYGMFDIFSNNPEFVFEIKHAKHGIYELQEFSLVDTKKALIALENLDDTDYILQRQAYDEERVSDYYSYVLANIDQTGITLFFNDRDPLSNDRKLLALLGFFGAYKALSDEEKRELRTLKTPDDLYTVFEYIADNRDSSDLSSIRFDVYNLDNARERQSFQQLKTEVHANQIMCLELLERLNRLGEEKLVEGFLKASSEDWVKCLGNKAPITMEELIELMSQ